MDQKNTTPLLPRTHHHMWWHWGETRGPSLSVPSLPKIPAHLLLSPGRRVSLDGLVGSGLDGHASVAFLGFVGLSDAASSVNLSAVLVGSQVNPLRGRLGVGSLWKFIVAVAHVLFVLLLFV